MDEAGTHVRYRPEYAVVAFPPAEAHGEGEAIGEVQRGAAQFDEVAERDGEQHDRESEALDYVCRDVS